MKKILILFTLLMSLTAINAKTDPGGHHGSSDPSCDNGGPGSVSCSISWGASHEVLGVTETASVTCGPGYYACCYNTILMPRGVCKPNN